MIILKDKRIAIILGLTGAVIILGAILTAFNIKNLSTPLIFHFDKYREVDLFGGLLDLWKITVIAVVALIINAVLAETFFYRERFFSYFLAIVSLITAVLSLIVIGTILSFN